MFFKVGNIVKNIRKNGYWFNCEGKIVKLRPLEEFPVVVLYDNGKGITCKSRNLRLIKRNENV